MILGEYGTEEGLFESVPEVSITCHWLSVKRSCFKRRVNGRPTCNVCNILRFLADLF